ncbi:hypothetical protein evm_010763 [Chilo suppressalis]|nr:hypothetical protein evm_010763 [Chilo suppressalis]
MKVTRALSLLFGLVCFVMGEEADNCYQLCPTVYDPVCGTDGVTYFSECFMTCGGAELSHDGACAETHTWM